MNILWISPRPPSRGQRYHGLIELEVTLLKILQYAFYSKFATFSGFKNIKFFFENQTFYYFDFEKAYYFSRILRQNSFNLMPKEI